MRVDVRHKRKVGTVTSLKENGHDSNEPNHLIQLLGVELADDNQEHPRHDTDEVDPELLCPKIVAGDFVDDVGDEASERTRDDVQETEHGSPSTGLCLTEVCKVLEIVCAKDRVDGKLAAERTEVSGAQHGGLEREHDFEALLQRGLYYDLVLSFVDDLDVSTGGLDIASGLLVLLLVTR
jgi:hypothetical protein